MTDTMRYPQFAGVPPRIYDWSTGRLLQNNTRRISYMDALWNPTLNANLPPTSEEIDAHVAAVGALQPDVLQGVHKSPSPHPIEDWQPYRTPLHAAADMRAKASGLSAAFRWPIGTARFLENLAIGLSELRPTWAICIKNARAPPIFHQPPPGARFDIHTFFHGTLLPNALMIMADGFRCTFGALTNKMRRHFGSLEYHPVTYCARHFTTAMQYPMYQMIEGYGCGHVLAETGTCYPIRVIFIVQGAQLRRLASQENQTAFLPYDMHISHVLFYAVERKFQEPDTMFAHSALVRKSLFVSMEIPDAHEKIITLIDHPAEYDIVPLISEYTERLRRAGQKADRLPIIRICEDDNNADDIRSVPPLGTGISTAQLLRGRTSFSRISSSTIRTCSNN